MRFGAGETFWDRIEQELGEVPSESEAVGTLAPCFLGLLASYAVILCRVSGSASEGKSKALSTCTTHVIIILLMFGPAIFIYTRPFTALSADKVVSFFHTVIFPLMNPVIYTLRNQEVKASMRRILSRHVFF